MINVRLLKFIGRLIKILNSREKFLVAFTILIRVSLVSLDLLGIYIIGTVVAFLSTSQIQSNSWFRTILAWLDENNIPNGYSVLFAIAIIFFIVKGLLSVALNKMTAAYLAKIESRKSSKVFEELLAQKIEKLEASSPQEIVFAATESVTAATTRAALLASTIIGEIALLAAISIYLMLTDAILFTMLGAFFVLVGLFLHNFVTKASGKLRQKMHFAHLASQGTLLDTIANFRQLALSKSKSTLVGKFTAERQIFAKASAQFETVTGLTRYIVEIAVMLGVGILVLQRSVGGQDASSAAIIAIFLAGIFRIVSSMVPLQAGLTAWKIIEFQATNALDLLEEPKRKIKNSDSARMRRKPAEVRIRNLSYEYEGKNSPVLRNVNLTLQPGTFAALVGSSGAGKSTLADLILGLRTPSAGTIHIDDLNVADHEKSTFQDIAYVPQKVTLFAGTLAQNVSLNFDRRADDELKQVKSALKKVGLLESLITLPSGLDTVVGEGGRQLSGGEIQRIGVARALYLKPRILILDEPTSALDPETQSLVSETLNKIRKKITILLITHRHETILKVDETYRISNGHVEKL